MSKRRACFGRSGGVVQTLGRIVEEGNQEMSEVVTTISTQVVAVAGRVEAANKGINSLHKRAYRQDAQIAALKNEVDEVKATLEHIEQLLTTLILLPDKTIPVAE